MAEFFVSTTAAGFYQPAGWRLPELRATAQGSSEVSRGGSSLASEYNEENGEGGSKPDSGNSSDGAGHKSGRESKGKPKSLSPGVGNALRDAYQEALREDVPPEMLDLLGKLG